MDYAKKSLELHYQLKGKIEIASRTKATTGSRSALHTPPASPHPALRYKRM